MKKQINTEEFVPQQENFIKDIQINQKKRVKTMLLILIVFDIFLLLSMIYFCVAFKRIFLTIACVVVYLLIIWRSIVTIKKAKINVQVKLYENSIDIYSSLGRTAVEFKYVYLSKTKKSLFQLIFKKPANTIMLVVRKENLKRVFIPFIDEDTQKLCDTITILSIKERTKKSPN